MYKRGSLPPSLDTQLWALSLQRNLSLFYPLNQTCFLRLPGRFSGVQSSHLGKKDSALVDSHHWHHEDEKEPGEVRQRVCPPSQQCQVGARRTWGSEISQKNPQKHLMGERGQRAATDWIVSPEKTRWIPNPSAPAEVTSLWMKICLAVISEVRSYGSRVGP